MVPPSAVAKIRVAGHDGPTSEVAMHRAPRGGRGPAFQTQGLAEAGVGVGEGGDPSACGAAWCWWCSPTITVLSNCQAMSLPLIASGAKARHSQAMGRNVRTACTKSLEPPKPRITERLHARTHTHNAGEAALVSGVAHDRRR